VHEFSEGLAAVKVADKWGYIDRQGAVAVSAKFDLVQDFKDGLARVWEGDYNGYINKNGRWVWRGRWRL
jgi:hypothetical protein